MREKEIRDVFLEAKRRNDDDDDEDEDEESSSYQIAQWMHSRPLLGDRAAVPRGSYVFNLAIL